MSLEKDSEIYDEEVTLYAEYIVTSIFLNNFPRREDMTIQDLIWYKTALKEKVEMDDQNKLNDRLLNLDNRFLLKDISDVTRLKASGGKTHSLIKERDLPSNRILNEMESKKRSDEEKLAWLDQLGEKLNKK